MGLFEQYISLVGRARLQLLLDIMPGGDGIRNPLFNFKNDRNAGSRGSLQGTSASLSQNTFIIKVPPRVASLTPYITSIIVFLWPADYLNVSFCFICNWQNRCNCAHVCADRNVPQHCRQRFVKVNIRPMWKINIENVPFVLCKSPRGNRNIEMITKYELVLLYKLTGKLQWY